MPFLWEREAVSLIARGRFSVFRSAWGSFFSRSVVAAWFTQSLFYAKLGRKIGVEKGGFWAFYLQRCEKSSNFAVSIRMTKRAVRRWKVLRWGRPPEDAVDARPGTAPEGPQLYGGSRRHHGGADQAVGVRPRTGGTGRGREAGRTGLSWDSYLAI